MSPRSKFTSAAAIALLCALGAVSAQARGADVQWSVTIGTPVVTLPAPVVAVPPPVVSVPAYPVYTRPVPVYVPAPYYREPTRWDVDGDGIPNRYDRVYNPVWDRNGDGVPDRRGHRYHHPDGDRDRDGIPNRWDRHDNRRDEWRGPY